MQESGLKLDQAANEVALGTTCAACQVRDLAFCAALDQAARQALQPHARRLEVRPGAVLAEEGAHGDDLFTVVDGVLMLFKALADGRRQIVGFRYPGELVTVRRDDLPWPVTVQAVTSATVCRIDSRKLAVIRASHPAIDRALLDLASDEIRAEQDQLLSVGRKNMEEKVAFFVLGICRRTRRRGGARQAFTLPMHRTEIADYLGLKTESVSRVFTRLRRCGILDLPHPNRVIVLNWPRLEALASGRGTLAPRAQRPRRSARQTAERGPI